MTNAISQSAHNPIAYEGQTDLLPEEVDVGLIAKKSLASLVLLLTNTAATLTVGVQHLTGFTILPSTLVGWITKPLHSFNTTLAQHAFTPFRQWAEALGNENTRIIETEKVISLRNGRLLFNTKNYANQAFTSLKAIVAPISLTLSAAHAALWVGSKPLYLAFYCPGLLADIILLISFFLNKALGDLTYEPIRNLSENMFESQDRFLTRTAPL